MGGHHGGISPVGPKVDTLGHILHVNLMVCVVARHADPPDLTQRQAEAPSKSKEASSPLGFQIHPSTSGPYAVSYTHLTLPTNREV